MRKLYRYTAVVANCHYVSHDSAAVMAAWAGKTSMLLATTPTSAGAIGVRGITSKRAGHESPPPSPNPAPPPGVQLPEGECDAGCKSTYENHGGALQAESS
jgi:hypothetical protein